MATAENIRKVEAIVRGDKKRRAIVVSAMGKFGEYNEKVTDQLFAGKIDAVFERFNNLANDLLPPDKFNIYKVDLHKTKNAIGNSTDRAFIVSRGEYLTAKLFALYLNYYFVDAGDIIVINPDGTANEKATKRNIHHAKLKRHSPFVMGGFYGKTADGRWAVFSRGGSDYSASVIAVLLKCKRYENWTDSCGIQSADPRHIYGTKTIQCLDFDALDILTHNGTTIIHPNVAQILKRHKLPLKIANTFRPDGLTTEVHSRHCHKCSSDFFCITHTADTILAVRKLGKTIKTTTYPTTAETLTADVQELHNKMTKNNPHDIIPNYDTGG